MKAQLMICLLAIGISCQEQHVTNAPAEEDKWTISWEFDNQVTYGSLYFKSNKARIVVNEPDALFFNQPEDVIFDWSVSNDTFYFTRPDNGFKIAYEIVNQQENFYELHHNSELIVKIYR